MIIYLIYSGLSMYILDLSKTHKHTHESEMLKHTHNVKYWECNFPYFVKVWVFFLFACLFVWFFGGWRYLIYFLKTKLPISQAVSDIAMYLQNSTACLFRMMELQALLLQSLLNRPRKLYIFLFFLKNLYSVLSEFLRDF